MVKKVNLSKNTDYAVLEPPDGTTETHLKVRTPGMDKSRRLRLSFENLIMVLVLVLVLAGML